MSGQGKLVVGYWKIRGLGAPCRMVCEYAEADYVSKVYEIKGDEKEWDMSDWYSVKPEMQKRNSLMNLPYVIDTDGFVVTQTVACLSYLGRKFRMFGSNEKEASMVVQVLCEAQDLRNSAVKVFYAGQSADLFNYLEKTAPSSYAKFEGWLEAQAKGPYTVGEFPTVGDFHLWEMLDQGELLAVDHAKESPLKNYPLLRKLYDSMRAEPKLQRYFSGSLYHLAINAPMAIWGNKPRSIGELYYFAVRARAEPLRLLLRYADIPYANHTVTFKDWPEVKKTMPNGQLPVLQLPSGKFLAETADLARYIAERAGAPLMPVEKEKKEAAARMFELSNTKPLFECALLLNLKTLEQAEQMTPDVVSESLKALSSLEQELSSLKEPFFGGAEPHYGEFGLFHSINLLLSLSKPSPKIPEMWMKWYGHMSELPTVKEYLNERPQAKSGKVGLPCSPIFNLDLDA